MKNISLPSTKHRGLARKKNRQKRKSFVRSFIPSERATLILVYRMPHSFLLAHRTANNMHERSEKYGIYLQPATDYTPTSHSHAMCNAASQAFSRFLRKISHNFHGMLFRKKTCMVSLQTFAQFDNRIYHRPRLIEYNNFIDIFIFLMNDNKKSKCTDKKLEYALFDNTFMRSICVSMFSGAFQE